MALCSGMPVLLLHTTVVSRWLVSPMDSSRSGGRPSEAARR